MQKASDQQIQSEIGQNNISSVILIPII